MTNATVEELRCWRCNRKLAERVSSPWEIRCPRCKATNKAVDRAVAKNLTPGVLAPQQGAKKTGD